MFCSGSSKLHTLNVCVSDDHSENEPVSHKLRWGIGRSQNYVKNSEKQIKTDKTIHERSERAFVRQEPKPADFWGLSVSLIIRSGLLKQHWRTEFLLCGGVKLLSRNHWLSKAQTQTQDRYLPSNYWSEGSMRSPNNTDYSHQTWLSTRTWSTIRAYCWRYYIYTLVTGLGEIKIALSESLPSSVWTAGISGLGASSLSQLWMLWITLTTHLASYGHWCNSSTDVSGSVGASKGYLTRLRVCSTGGNSRLVL